MDDKMFLGIMGQGAKHDLQKVIECNQYTQKFGICISEQDALVLLQNRKNNLKEQERVEFGESILPKLVFTFCDSPYIYQDNYVDTIGALQEIFYFYKNESLDELSDDELLEYMKEHFEGDCQGSLDYLETNCLEKFSREIRAGSQSFIGANRDEE